MKEDLEDWTGKEKSGMRENLRNVPTTPQGCAGPSD